MTEIEAAVQNLYRELDVPPPSDDYPIAPLKPLLSRLPILCVELPRLTCRAAQDYLMDRQAIDKPLALEDASQASDELAGFAFQGGESAFLFVKPEDPVVRRRFSMAHELGHYILHFRPEVRRWREALAADEEIRPVLFDAFMQTEIDAFEERAEDARYEQREREADQFAADLLLPERVVAARADALGQEFSHDRAGLEERLAMEFLVSRAAMRRRLATLAQDVRSS